MTFFLFIVIDLLSGFQPLTIIILYRLFLFPIVFTLFTPLIYTHTHLHPIFPFRFYTLLSTLVTVNTAYTFYFFLLHHCTNSLSSALHIFVHHCTFCASLHVKTIPDPSLCLHQEQLQIHACNHVSCSSCSAINSSLSDSIEKVPLL